MNTTEVILIALAFAVLGIRLYKKYVKKNRDKPGTGALPRTSFPSSSKDDNYEPYSKE